MISITTATVAAITIDATTAAKERKATTTNKKRKAKERNKKKIQFNESKSTKFFNKISYRRVNAADFKNESFIQDCYDFILQYLNPFFMERKYNADNKKLLQLFWENCMSIELLNFIKLDEDLRKINDLDVKFNTCKSIVCNFMKHNKNSFALLKLNFSKEYLIIQIIFSKIFPNFYFKVDVQHKIIYDILKNWQATKNAEMKNIVEKKDTLPAAVIVITQEEKGVIVIKDENVDDQGKKTMITKNLFQQCQLLNEKN